jgi:DNA-binding Lrp family transcriptional regulator
MTIARHVPQKVVQRAAIVAWTTGLGAITAEALAERDGLSTAVALERLDEAVELGLMVRKTVLVGYSSLYGVTAAGRKLALKHADTGEYAYPKGIRTTSITIGQARHTIACASVAAALEHRYPSYRLIGERELRRDEHAQGRRLATVETLQDGGARRSHCPDLVIWPPATPETQSPLPIAVEVELTNKDKRELTENCHAMARCNYIEAFLYYAETTAIENRLLKMIEELKAEDKIVVNPLSEIVNSLPGFNLGQGEESTTYR